MAAIQHTVELQVAAIEKGQLIARSTNHDRPYL